MRALTNTSDAPLDVLKRVVAEANRLTGAKVFVSDKPMPEDPYDYDTRFYSYKNALASGMLSIWTSDNRDLSQFWREYRRLLEEHYAAGKEVRS